MKFQKSILINKNSNKLWNCDKEILVLTDYKFWIFKWYMNYFPISKTLRIDELLIKIHCHFQKFGRAILLLKSINDPERFFTLFEEVGNNLLIKSFYLEKQEIIDRLIELYNFMKSKPEFEYFMHTINFYYSRFLLKLIAKKAIIIALKLSISTKIPYLFRVLYSFSLCYNYPFMYDLVKSEFEKIEQYGPEHEIQMICDWSHKTLTTEDMNNLVNDYSILCNTNQLKELDLDEFNSWGIDINEYDSALDLELNGELDKALEKYTKCKLKADIKRIKVLKDANKYLDDSILFIDYPNGK